MRKLPSRHLGANRGCSSNPPNSRNASWRTRGDGYALAKEEGVSVRELNAVLKSEVVRPFGTGGGQEVSVELRAGAFETGLVGITVRVCCPWSKHTDNWEDLSAWLSPDEARALACALVMAAGGAR